MGCLRLHEDDERVLWQVHKKGESSSKDYHYAYNNPVNLSDPTGLMPNSPPSPSGMGLSAEDKRRGGRGGGGFRVPGFSGMGGGRMGWNNGTGFNADGSTRYGSFGSAYSDVFAMATEAWNGTSSGGFSKSYYGRRSGLLGRLSTTNYFVQGDGNGNGVINSDLGTFTIGSGGGNIFREGGGFGNWLASAGTLDLSTAVADCKDCNYFGYWGHFFSSTGKTIGIWWDKAWNFKQGGIEQWKDPDGLPSTDPGVQGKNVSGMDGFRLKYPGSAPLHLYEAGKSSADFLDAANGASKSFFGVDIFGRSNGDQVRQVNDSTWLLGNENSSNIYFMQTVNGDSAFQIGTGLNKQNSAWDPISKTWKATN